MVIIFATTWNSKCGIAAYSRALVPELEKHVRVEVLGLDSGDISSPARLAAALNRGGVAHIQHQYPFFGGMAVYRNWFRRLLRRVDVPLVVTVHELDLGESDSRMLCAYKHWFNRYLFGAAAIDRIIVHSFEYRDKLQALGIESGVIRVVPMGVPEVAKADVSSDAAKSTLGLEGKRVVTIFGFVVKRKGYEVALEALRCWPEDVVLLVAGGAHPDDSTGFFEELKGRVIARGLEDRTVISGYLPDDQVPVVMAATDVVIAPFTAMSGSWSIMHSIAYGKPVVASDLPSSREMNDRMLCLTLFNPGDPSDLADKTKELLEDEARLAQAVASVQSYAAAWTVARSAAETIAVYEELLGEARQGSAPQR